MKRQKYIEILSDTEENELYQSKQVELLQKQIQEQSAMVKSRVGLVLAINKKYIPGSAQEKKKLLSQRIKKMFLDKTSFDISKDYFCVKRQPNYNQLNCHLELCQLLVFGTDFWPTRQILSDANVLKLKVQAIKIDNSHTKLKFASEQDARLWLRTYLLDNDTKRKVEEDQNQEMVQQPVEQNVDKLKGWFKIQSHFYQGFQRQRDIRYCTNYQKDIQAMVQDTQMTNYQKFKQLIQKQFNEEKSQNIQLQQSQMKEQRRHKYNRQNDRSRNYKNSRNQSRRFQKHKKPYIQRTYCFSPQYQMQREDRSRNKHQKNHQSFRKQQKKHNQSHSQSYFEAKKHQKTWNNILQDIQSQHNDNESNLSFLLQKSDKNANNQINSITNALNNMNLQNDNDMSIQLAPVRKEDSSPINVSVMLDAQQIKENDKQKQKQKEPNFKKNECTILDKSSTYTQNLKKSRKKQFQRSYHLKNNQKSFDYLAYIQDCEKKEEIHKIGEPIIRQ